MGKGMGEGMGEGEGEGDGEGEGEGEGPSQPRHRCLQQFMNSNGLISTPTGSLRIKCYGMKSDGLIRTPTPASYV